MRLSTRDRYVHDSVFHALVDTLLVCVQTHPDVTPTELREAAMLAATMHEQSLVRPLLMDDEGNILPRSARPLA